MKVKNGFVLRQVVGSWMIVPIGEQAAAINGIISLNETAAAIWKCLEKGSTLENIVETLCNEFEVEKEEAEEAVNEFIAELKEKDILE